MIAQWLYTTRRPCTNCGRVPYSRAVLHTNDDGQTAGIYCSDPECSDAETRAWKAGTQ